MMAPRIPARGEDFALAPVPLGRERRGTSSLLAFLLAFLPLSFSCS